MTTTTTDAVTVRAVAGPHIVRVQHEGLVTRDAEKSRDFYVTVLGLHPLPRPKLSSHGYWLGTEGCYPQLHIIQSDSPVPGADAPIKPTARHTCFEVVDYDALKALFVREGIPYVENEQPGGRRQMLINDPDGNTLEFQRVTM
jgi:catechol 2,3-dioxygenase-like lactoylglutathione lyase family enzyme